MMCMLCACDQSNCLYKELLSRGKNDSEEIARGTKRAVERAKSDEITQETGLMEEDFLTTQMHQDFGLKAGTVLTGTIVTMPIVG